MRLKETLERLLPEVDRVSINVNRTAILDSRPEDTDLIVSVVRASDGSASGRDLIFSTGGQRDETFFRRSLARFGFPSEEYSAAKVLNYYSLRMQYLGSLVLWQHTARPEIERAADRISRLEGLIRYLFVGIVARFQAVHPQYSAATERVNSLLDHARLSLREREVFFCRFNGMSVERIASILCISEATVRRHLRSINSRLRSSEQASREQVAGVPSPRRQTIAR